MKEYIIQNKEGRTERIAFLYANDERGGWETFKEARLHSFDRTVAYSPFIAIMGFDHWRPVEFGTFEERALSATEKKEFRQNFFEEIKREEGWERIK